MTLMDFCGVILGFPVLNRIQLTVHVGKTSDIQIVSSFLNTVSQLF